MGLPPDYTAARDLCAELHSHAQSEPMDLDLMGSKIRNALSNPSTRRFIAAYMGRTLTGSVPDYSLWDPPSY